MISTPRKNPTTAPIIIQYGLCCITKRYAGGNISLFSIEYIKQHIITLYGAINQGN